MKKTAFMICAFLSLWTASAQAETAQDVYRAFKKLEARCQEGITKAEYIKELGEVRFALNMFSESKGAKGHETVVASFNRVAEHLKLAGVWFNEKNIVPPRKPDLKVWPKNMHKQLSYDYEKSMVSHKALVAKFHKQYPETARLESEGGATSKDDPLFLYTGRIVTDSLGPCLYRAQSSWCLNPKVVAMPTTIISALDPINTTLIMERINHSYITFLGPEG